MKKLIFFIPFTLLLISCEKDKLVPNSEIPGWFKDRIAYNEDVIKSGTNSALRIAAWIRYKYDGNYYFEFDNPISSAWRETYKFDGTEYNSNDSSFNNYQSKKCCKQYVWKGPEYFND